MIENTGNGSRVRLSCDCAACEGMAPITADARIANGVSKPAERRAVAHSFVQYAHGASPLSAVMCGRYAVEVTG